MGSIVNTINPASALPAEGFENYLSETTKIAVPFTDIVNRANIINLAADGGVRMGINRMQLQKLKRIKSESGASGEEVHGVYGDKLDQIRCVGPWILGNDGNGARPYLDTKEGYIEVTFYGTGLNLLLRVDNNALDIRVSVDGGAEGANVDIFTSSIPIAERNYATNQPVTMVSGLTLGLHTVKIRKATTANAWAIYGLEILNETASLDITPNTAYIKGEPVDIIQATESYNSGWTNETGTSGAKGGQVVVYSDNQGVVKKDIQWTDVSQLNLAAADHSNEEIIKRVNWREFGAERADDFSTLSSGLADVAFTLDDGTTTLVGNDVQFSQPDRLTNPGIDDFVTLTFIGTGLDLVAYDGAAGGGAAPGDIYEISIDGSVIGTKAPASVGEATIPIVSGLSYGTHTFKIRRTVNALIDYFDMKDFIIYGPKKPSLPADSIELGSYYLMADFVANTTQSSTDISTGVIRKSALREMVYEGSAWAVSFSPVQTLTGAIVYTNTVTDKIKYTFFGTGFDMRHLGEGNGSADISATLNGLDLTTANFGTAVSSTYGSGAGFDLASTAILDQKMTVGNLEGCGWIIKDLPLDLYELELELNDGDYLRIGALDIITPIHSPKQINSAINNAIEIGSQGISDTRNFKSYDIDDEVNWVKAENKGGGSVTTSTEFIPLPLMNCSIKTTGGPIEVAFSATAERADGNHSYYTIFLDGVNVGPQAVKQTTHRDPFAIVSTFDVAPGYHQVSIHWRVSGGSGTTNGDSALIVKELK